MQDNIVFNVSSRFFIIGIDKFPHKLKLSVNENIISYKTKNDCSGNLAYFPITNIFGTII